MRKIVSFLLVLFISVALGDDSFIQPYILIGETGKNISDTEGDLVESFFMNNIEILGRYRPAGDPHRFVIVVTNQDLIQAVKRGKPSAGYAAAMRVAITKEGEMTYVSCQNPEYWGNAYFQDDYPKVSKNIAAFKRKLMRALPKMRGRFNRQFGSSRNFTAKDMRHYRYMFGMPYFEDSVKLGTFSSYEEAVETIERNLEISTTCEKVFGKEIPDKRVKLYGVGLGGDSGEGYFLPTIDVAKMKHTAALPYDLLVIDNEVYMLHGRFRIASSFPDLTMMTFGKIMSTPGDISEMMEA